jgi:hypothetical protein
LCLYITCCRGRCGDERKVREIVTRGRTVLGRKIDVLA